MHADFSDKLMELLSIIEQRDYGKLPAFALDVPEKFNRVRDVFEPIVVNRNAGRTMLEMVIRFPGATKSNIFCAIYYICIELRG